VALLAVRNLEEATAQLSWRKASEIEADWESSDDRLGPRFAALTVPRQEVSSGLLWQLK
jgi:hypothetical protein